MSSNSDNHNFIHYKIKVCIQTLKNEKFLSIFKKIESFPPSWNQGGSNPNFTNLREVQDKSEF